MAFLFLKPPTHRVFDYKPLYYNERKEALDEKLENARKKETGEYVPGDAIKGGFKKIKYDAKRSKGTSSLVRLVTVLALAALLIALFYFTQVFDIFMNS